MMTLGDYEDTLKSFNWNYSMEEDYRIWKENHDLHTSLIKLSSNSKDYKALYDKYSPQRTRSLTTE